MVACLTCVLPTLVAVGFGLLCSGLPAKWGLLALLDEVEVGRGQFLKGMCPAFHVGKEWGFTHEQMTKLDLSGQTFVVTGANSGLGFWTAQHLAAAKASNVVLACRSMPKCEKAVAEIQEATGRRDGIVAMELDLSSFASVLGFSRLFKNQYSALDSLILNAGVMACPYALTRDGLEMQIGTNHFGHQLLATELQPQLESAVAARGVATVVSVSSAAHFDSYPEGILPTVVAMNDQDSYSKWKAYGQSKLANVLFAQELAKRWKSKNILVNVIHPGGVATELSRHLEAEIANMLGSGMQQALKPFMATPLWEPKDAALTQLYAAVSPEIAKGKITGKYYHPIARQTTPDPHASNQTLQSELWQTTEAFIVTWKTQNHT